MQEEEFDCQCLITVLENAFADKTLDPQRIKMNLMFQNGEDLRKFKAVLDQIRQVPQYSMQNQEHNQPQGFNLRPNSQQMIQQNQQNSSAFSDIESHVSIQSMGYKEKPNDSQQGRLNSQESDIPILFGSLRDSQQKKEIMNSYKNDERQNNRKPEVMQPLGYQPNNIQDQYPIPNRRSLNQGPEIYQQNSSNQMLINKQEGERKLVSQNINAFKQNQEPGHFKYNVNSKRQNQFVNDYDVDVQDINNSRGKQKQDLDDDESEKNDSNIISGSFKSMIKGDNLKYQDLVNHVSQSSLLSNFKQPSYTRIMQGMYKFDLEPILVVLFKKDSKLQAIFRENNIEFVNEGPLIEKHLTFRLKNQQSIDFVVNFLDYLQTFKQFIQKGVTRRDIQAMMNNIKFQNIILKENIFVFVDRQQVDKGLVWFSMEKDEGEMKLLSKKYTDTYSYKRIFLLNNFADQGLRESDQSPEMLIHLNSIMIVRRQFYYNQIEGMEEMFPNLEISYQQLSFQERQDTKNYRQHFSVCFKKVDHNEYLTMRNLVLEEPSSELINFLIVIQPNIAIKEFVQNNYYSSYMPTQMKFLNNNIISVQCSLQEIKNKVIEVMKNYQILHLEFVEDGSILSNINEVLSEKLIRSDFPAEGGIIKVVDIEKFLLLD